MNFYVLLYNEIFYIIFMIINIFNIFMIIYMINIIYNYKINLLY